MNQYVVISLCCKSSAPESTDEPPWPRLCQAESMPRDLVCSGYESTSETLRPAQRRCSRAASGFEALP